ncbi:MAG: AN1-type zinc finger domain-containing protein [Candidatus Heimdallarchaeota archaeon]
MVYCEHCGESVAFPFRCRYCLGIFCDKCRLPETHQCINLNQVRSQRKEIIPEPEKKLDQAKADRGWIRSPEYQSLKGGIGRILTIPVSDIRSREPWRVMGGTTTGNEALDILVAASLIFGVLSFRNIVFPGLSGGRSYLAGILLTILTGFIGHELAHRSIAKRKGLHARFVLWTQGIIFTLIGLILPIVFIVPGFVFMTGYAGRIAQGKISLSGPLINILNGLILLFLGLITDVSVWGLNFTNVFLLAAQYNFFLALFNLIPIGPLDGRKVREWNPTIWIAALGSALLLWVLIFVL